MISLVVTYFLFSTIQNLYFCLAFQIIQQDIKIPSATTLTRLFTTKYTIVLTCICDILPSDSKISLAIDQWTLVNKWAIISIIASGINHNLVLEMLQLLFEEYKGSNNSNILGAHLLNILCYFDLNTSWLLGITTDNTTFNYKIAKALKEELIRDGTQ
jgi:hypothetical protein